MAFPQHKPLKKRKKKVLGRFDDRCVARFFQVGGISSPIGQCRLRNRVLKVVSNLILKCNAQTSVPTSYICSMHVLLLSVFIPRFVALSFKLGHRIIFTR